MKAVFLDRATLSPTLALNLPVGVTLESFPQTAPAEVVPRLQGATIAIVNKVRLGAKEMAALPELKLIQIAATGMDNIDLDAAQARGIAVQNVAGYSTESVAEHTWMLILSALRALVPYTDAIRNGAWHPKGLFCLNQYPILDAHGKTLVIVGGGNIGQRVASVARALGMTVFFAEHRGRPARNDDYLPFEEALARADIISLHCPLTPETTALINEETLKLMHRRPLLVNLARGGVVDTAAVVRALDAEQLLGYATDVLAQEPPQPEEPLLQVLPHPRVLLTAHNAWASEGAQQQLWQRLSARIAAFLASTATP